MRGFTGGWTFFGSLGIAAALIAGRTSLGQEEAVPAATKSAPATHKQKTIVKVASPNAREKLQGFCVDADGRILALVSGASPDESDIPAPAESAAKKKKPEFASEVRAYDADGELIEKWKVGFSAQAINTAPDGTVVVGGEGRVARFDARGKKLHEGDSPQMTYINEHPDEMREKAKEQLESDRAMYAEQVKQFEEQLTALKAKKKETKPKAKPKAGDKEPADKEPAEAKPTEEAQAFQIGEQQIVQILASYKQQVERLEKQTVEQTLDQVLARAKRTHAIAASDKDVFVTCSALTGYGFAVWRTDEKFGAPKQIVKSLSGCCGQMDVQCHGGELNVCENSRHRVVRLDRDGKELSQFGKRDREGEGENFGGCCNPMNLCFNKQGDLYVSESNGVVKHFTPSGKYLGIVGIATVPAGCKNSCVGVTADDSRLFYIDAEKSQIIVLAREEKVSKK